LDRHGTRALKHDWTERLANLKVNEVWEVFSGKIVELVEEHVPVKTM
jgi:hypothetical protein